LGVAVLAAPLRAGRGRLRQDRPADSGAHPAWPGSGRAGSPAARA